jgi:hypothetical protein
MVVQFSGMNGGLFCADAVSGTMGTIRDFKGVFIGLGGNIWFVRAGVVCSRGYFDGLGVVGVSRKIWLVKQMCWVSKC